MALHGTAWQPTAIGPDRVVVQATTRATATIESLSA